MTFVSLSLLERLSFSPWIPWTTWSRAASWGWASAVLTPDMKNFNFACDLRIWTKRPKRGPRIISGLGAKRKDRKSTRVDDSKIGRARPIELQRGADPFSLCKLSSTAAGKSVCCCCWSGRHHSDPEWSWLHIINIVREGARERERERYIYMWLYMYYRYIIVYIYICTYIYRCA